MMIIGITGGIGSGKTIVCNIFLQLGIPVYEADSIAKKLYESEPGIRDRIRNEVSENVFDKKGKLDKQKLAALVFQDDAALKKLNKIVHPVVAKHFAEWKKQNLAAPYVLKEAAILFESGADQDCEKIITVTSPEELRIQRTMQRDKRSKAEVEQIIQKQWSDEEKIKQSDFVIVNDEHQLVIPQVLEIHNKLLAITQSSTA